MEHDYSYESGGMNSLFEVKMPADMDNETRETFGASVLSVDFSKPESGYIIIGCRNPYITNLLRKENERTPIIGEWICKSYDKDEVCGDYASPLSIVEYSRLGCKTIEYRFEKPEIRVFSGNGIYDKNSDVAFKVTYSSVSAEIHEIEQ